MPTRQGSSTVWLETSWLGCTDQPPYSEAVEVVLARGADVLADGDTDAGVALPADVGGAGAGLGGDEGLGRGQQRGEEEQQHGDPGAADSYPTRAPTDEDHVPPRLVASDSGEVAREVGHSK